MNKGLTVLLTSLCLVLIGCGDSKKNKDHNNNDQHQQALFAVPSADCLNQYDCQPSDRYIKRMERGKYIKDYPIANHDTPYYEDHQDGYSRGFCGCDAGYHPTYENGAVICAMIHKVHETEKLVAFDLKYEKITKELHKSRSRSYSPVTFGGEAPQRIIGKYDHRDHRNQAYSKRNRWNNNDGYSNYRPRFKNNWERKRWERKKRRKFRRKRHAKKHRVVKQIQKLVKEKFSFSFIARSTSKRITRRTVKNPTCSPGVVRACDSYTPCSGNNRCRFYPNQDYGLCIH